MEILPQDIAFDFDGVVADTFRLFVELARSRYNVDIEYEKITHYEFLDVIDMDRQDAEQIIDVLTMLPKDLYLSPNKGAVDVLTKIADISRLLFVTARPTKEPVVKWFGKHLPHVDSDYIRIEATGVTTKKLGVLKDYGIKYFIDDRLDTCQMLDKAGITPIIYDQPWNREPHPFVVVRDWDDIAGMIDWSSQADRACNSII